MTVVHCLPIDFSLLKIVQIETHVAKRRDRSKFVCFMIQTQTNKKQIKLNKRKRTKKTVKFCEKLELVFIDVYNVFFAN